MLTQPPRHATTMLGQLTPASGQTEMSSGVLQLTVPSLLRHLSSGTFDFATLCPTSTNK